jgi:proteic killer suppression protein
MSLLLGTILREKGFDPLTHLSLRDLSPLKSVGLHKLKGDRAGQWAMTVNDRWRICFRFKDGDAYDVEIVDYHRG